MLFAHREAAGWQLAKLLLAYKARPKTMVLGLPRGGVVTAAVVARELHLPLDIVCARKIGVPGNPEFGIGAITEDGVGYYDESSIESLGISAEYLQAESQRQQKEAQRRATVYRHNRPALDFSGGTVILVDDGIATGATMMAAIEYVRRRGAAEVVVAVPVLPFDSLDRFSRSADQLIYVSAPAHFMAVGEFYEKFDPTEDKEVISLLKEAGRD